MPGLPRLSGRAIAKAFIRDGWELVRQKGSHMILAKDGSWATPSVPDHREVAPGTLRSLIRASGMTVEQFASLAKK
ncbi:MAG: addiction module toxin, HicA family [Opitutus sp.]|nr:addiction module toxin, HicA family [Opitutus sp.]